MPTRWRHSRCTPSSCTSSVVWLLLSILRGRWDLLLGLLAEGATTAVWLVRRRREVLLMSGWGGHLLIRGWSASVEIRVVRTSLLGLLELSR